MVRNRPSKHRVDRRARRRLEPDVADEKLQSPVLALQRSAGNATTTHLLRQASAVAETVAPAKPDDESVAVALLKDTVVNLVENYVEDAVPPAKIIIVGAKLGKAFADGAGEALLEANKRLSAQYAEDVEKSFSPQGDIGPKEWEHLQNVRRWQANSVAELNGILRAGMISAGRQALSELSEVVAEKAVEAAFDKFAEASAEKMTVYVRDRVTGKIASETFAAMPPGQVSGIGAKVGREITKAFAQALASYGVEKRLWPALETAAKLKEAGVPADLAEEAARGYAAVKLDFEGIRASVEQKVDRLRELLAGSYEWRAQEPSAGPNLDRYLREFQRAHDELRTLKGKYSWWGKTLGTKETLVIMAKIGQALDDAGLALQGLEMVADDFSYKTGARFAGGISFVPEREALYDLLRHMRR